MVGDDANGNVRVFILAIALAGDTLHMVQNRLHRVHLKQIAYVLHHTGQAFQAHASIDVGALQASIGALTVRIELAEH